MDRDCDSCKKQKTMECPNSSECYALESKPYWEKHAFKQAKAESLARELVEALKHIERLAELARRRSRYPGAVMSYGAEIRLAVEGALEKAKEVLGDE